LNTGDGLLSMVHMLNIIAKSNARVQDLLAGLKIYPQCSKTSPSPTKAKYWNRRPKGLDSRVEQELVLPAAF
jgi:phosphomannomutase